MTTMPMGPRRQAGSTGERRETTDPPLQGRGSGSAGKKRSEPRRYMGVRFTERQRDLIKMAADYRREYLHDYIWERIQGHVLQDVAELRRELNALGPLGDEEDQ